MIAIGKTSGIRMLDSGRTGPARAELTGEANFKVMSFTRLNYSYLIQIYLQFANYSSYRNLHEQRYQALASRPQNQDYKTTKS